MSTITIRIEVPVRVEREGDGYLACALGLDVWAQGATFENARDSLQDALGGFFKSCLDRKVLDDVLLEAGYRQQLEEAESNQADRLSIPLFLGALGNGCDGDQAIAC